MPEMIDLTVNPSGRDRAVRRARERGIIIPTFRQQIDPRLIPREVGGGLREVGLWDLNLTPNCGRTTRITRAQRGRGLGEQASDRRADERGLRRELRRHCGAARHAEQLRERCRRGQHR